MVVGDQSRDLVHDLRAFHIRHVVDVEAIDAGRKQALPARKRMRPNNRVVRQEVQPCVACGTARAAVHSARVFFCGLGEGGGFMRGRQGFEKPFVRSGEAIIQLIAGGPERVYE